MSTLVNTDNLGDALTEFVEVWSSYELHHDIGGSLSCGEAEALAGALRALGAPEAADSLIGYHGEHDDEGDEHYRPFVDG